MRAHALVGIAVGSILGFVPAIVLRAQGRNDSPHGDLTLDCGDCHGSDGWVPVDVPSKFDHASTGFVLDGTHAHASCRSCHGSLVFSQVGTACGDCHLDPHRGELGVACETCHRPTTWMNQREMFQVHSRTRFPLMSIHARLDCTSCHRDQRPFQFASTPAECGTCHLETYLETTNPQHLPAGFSRQCEECHGVTSVSWEGARFSHTARFPLVGGHAGVPCASCHGSGHYQGLPSTCVSCHQDDYSRTTNPNHASSSFPLSCDDCHTIDDWRPATFDHDLSRFPLTGAHVQADCAACHVGGRFTGTPTDCDACHQSDYDRTTNPNHRASAFPTECEGCHETDAWRPARFDHGRTRFPLTGAHRGAPCTGCHAGGRYSGTPTDCFACHQDDYNGTVNPNHRSAGLPAQCQACHSTRAWRPADFDHDARSFPIFSGTHRGKWSSCSDCHVSPGNFQVFECIRCHEHSNQAMVDTIHWGISGYVYQSAACYRCHPTGQR
jgi:hypothetical protein